MVFISLGPGVKKTIGDACSEEMPGVYDAISKPDLLFATSSFSQTAYIDCILFLLPLQFSYDTSIIFILTPQKVKASTSYNLRIIYINRFQVYKYQISFESYNCGSRGRVNILKCLIERRGLASESHRR